MKIISLNSRGIGGEKKEWVQNICRVEGPCVFGLLELMCKGVDEDWIEDI